MPNATLDFFCGKAGAGKSTMAAALAREHNAILLSEDVWLSRLYGEQIRVFDDYIRFSRSLESAIGPLVCDLLRLGQTVVMDFQANTRRRRSWFRALFAQANARHVLHFLQTPEEVCLQRISRRNAELPEGASKLTEADYWHVTSYFEPPEESEGFNLRAYAS